MTNPQGVKRKSVSRGVQEYDVVIVGGGNSAGYLCKTLVDCEFSGSVAIVSQEHVAPYERPALTKAFLHPPGAKVRARLPGFHTSVGGGGERQTEEWYSEHGMDLMLDSTAVQVNLEKKNVTVQHKNLTHRELKYSKLVFATGARAISPQDVGMKNANLGYVYTIREEQGAMEMIQTIEERGDELKEMVIVGGGYIALECAAAFAGWGFQVTLVYPGSALLERLFPDPVGRAFENLLETRGVEIVKGTSVRELVESTTQKGTVGGVLLKSGKVLTASTVIFGIGGRLNDHLFKDLDLCKAPLDVGGLAVNSDFRTTNADVYAIGDIASVEGHRRHEHVDFCRKSAERCGKVIALGKSQGEFNYIPYFYSRLFEYTDAPAVFQFYGDPDTKNGQNAKMIGDVKGALSCKAGDKMPVFGAIWYKSGTRQVTGMLLVNASSEQYEKAKSAVAEQADASDELTERILTE